MRVHLRNQKVEMKANYPPPPKARGARSQLPKCCRPVPSRKGRPVLKTKLHHPNPLKSGLNRPNPGLPPPNQGQRRPIRQRILEKVKAGHPPCSPVLIVRGSTRVRKPSRITSAPLAVKGITLYSRNA